MSDDIEEAKTYLRNLLTSFVHEHCDPVPEWAPLPDLVGMLTQIDNAITVTRDRQAEIARLREALSNLERYLRDTPHHNAIEAAAARKVLALEQKS